MLFNITGRHTKITESIKEHARQKTSKLPKYYNSINQIEVIIDASAKPATKVEIIARGEHSNIFIGTEIGDDVCKCIDKAVHKLERQLRRKKTKERNNKHISGT